MVHLIFAFQLNLLLGVIARFLHVVDTAGMAAGVAAGTVVLHWAGAAGYAPFAVGALTAGWIVWVHRRPQKDAEWRPTPAVPSLGQVAASCLAPTVLAASWDALPDPQLARVGVVAGCASALDIILASRKGRPAGATANAGSPFWHIVSCFIPPLGGAGTVALTGLASGAIRFWHVWMVLLSACVGLVLCAIAGRISRRMMRAIKDDRSERRDAALRALIVTVAGSAIGVALAYASRS